MGGVCCCRQEGDTVLSQDQFIVSPIQEPAEASGPSASVLAAQSAQQAECRRKCGLAAKAVRGRATKEIESSWKKVSAEYDVQKMIWQSVSSQRGASYKSGVETLSSKMEKAIQIHATSFDEAMATLESCVEMQKDKPDLLSKAVSDAIDLVKKAVAVDEVRKRLAAALEDTCAGKAPSDEVLAAFDDMLTTSNFKDDKFENAVKVAWKGATQQL
eukprot:TRINITY_DN78815_c0_g1_i1.p1 TRINITY_DN78815_c0_g1~~TRINITY_DN78815_c0_g1_i1.p1  ORF type:complete len:231 (-),score=72.55 TRINITY_DN78815_c0_g1_i1:72-716(-)